MKIYIGKSIDEMNNWTFTEVLDGNYYSPDIYIDPDGRIWVAYWTGILGSNGDIEIIYSDDEGESWSVAQTVVATVPNQRPGLIMGEDGNLFVSIIAAANTLKYFVSDDLGATWTEHTHIVAL